MVGKKLTLRAMIEDKVVAILALVVAERRTLQALWKILTRHNDRCRANPTPLLLARLPGGKYAFEAQWERLGTGYWQDANTASLDRQG